MELIQFSTLTCPPCRMAKEYIERNYDINVINYTYIPVEYLNEFDPRYKEILKGIKSRSVPIFVVMDGDNLVYTFVGFDKQEIGKYAEYVLKNSKNKIQDNIPEELETKIISLQNYLIEDLDNLNPPSQNGHGSYDEDDYIDDLNNDDFDDYEEDEDDDLIDG